MLQEGLAIARAIHDRYHASRRNPWNEVECGDHYARSMASYGVFLAACGYEYHGPQGHLAFAPRLTPENFRAPVTTAEGWGTFSQKADGGKMKAEVALKWGKLRLKSLALTLPAVAWWGGWGGLGWGGWGGWGGLGWGGWGWPWWGGWSWGWPSWGLGWGGLWW